MKHGDGWQMPDISPAEIADFYASQVRLAPVPVDVWSRIDGAVLHFYTVLDKTRKAESAVYAAERKVLQKYGSTVEFHVYPDRTPLKALLGELTPILQLV
jgi:hypothetical protein